MVSTHAIERRVWELTFLRRRQPTYCCHNVVLYEEWVPWTLECSPNSRLTTAAFYKLRTSSNNADNFFFRFIISIQIHKHPTIYKRCSPWKFFGLNSLPDNPIFKRRDGSFTSVDCIRRIVCVFNFYSNALSIHFWKPPSILVLCSQWQVFHLRKLRGLKLQNFLSQKYSQKYQSADGNDVFHHIFTLPANCVSSVKFNSFFQDYVNVFQEEPSLPTLISTSSPDFVFDFCKCRIWDIRQ